MYFDVFEFRYEFLDGKSSGTVIGRKGTNSTTSLLDVCLVALLPQRGEASV